MKDGMTMTDNTEPRRRDRGARPERMTIGGVTMVRNDIVAAEMGVVERTINRDDKDGAPYTYFGNVKYRPIEAYHQFLLKQVKQQGQAPQRPQRRRLTR
jgi:hypothetical protein